MNDVVFVHLSDIHFRTTNEGFDLDWDLRDNLETDLVKLLRENDIPAPTAFLVSGDIAFSGHPSEYAESMEWLAGFLETSGCERVLTVPGNHDVDRRAVSEDKAVQAMHRELRKCPPQQITTRLDEWVNKRPSGGADVFAPLAAYNEFARPFGCDVAPDRLWWEERFPLGVSAQVVVRGIPSALISDARDSDLADDRKLVLGKNQLLIPRGDNVVHVVMCHHPPEWCRDGNEVRRTLNSRTQLQFFGHKHVHSLERVDGTLIVSAGALQPERDADWLPRYNVVHLRLYGRGESRVLRVNVHPRVWDFDLTRFRGDFGSLGSPRITFDIDFPEPQAPTVGSTERRRESTLGNLARRNEFFTGRDNLLGEVTRLIQGGPVALVGQPGIGKSQVALEYAYRNQSEYAVVWWVDAESRTTATRDLLALAKQLTNVEREHPDLRNLTQMVTRALPTGGRALLVLDNADDPSLIGSLTSDEGMAEVLLTSRRQTWTPLAEVLAVERLSEADAMLFVQRRTGEQDPDLCARLATALDHLPLALELACALMSERGMSIADYLRELTADTREEGPPPNLEQGIARTVRLAVSDLRESHPLALELLSTLVFVAPDELPLDVVTDHYYPSIADRILGPSQVRDALDVLADRSLVSITGDALDIHRKTQGAVRERLTPGECREAAFEAVHMIRDAFLAVSEERSEKLLIERLMPHVFAAADLESYLRCTRRDVARAEDAWVRMAISFLLETSDLLVERRHPEASTPAERAVVLASETGSPRLTEAMRTAASSHRSLGRLEAARQHYEKALALDEEAWGPDADAVADDLHGLASTMRQLGGLTQARIYAERALAIRVANSGADDWKIRDELLQLSLIARSEADRKAARRHLEQALMIDERVAGDNSALLEQLAELSAEEGHFGEAIAHMQSALELDEQNLGENHWAIPRDLRRLAKFLTYDGQIRRASECLERALDVHLTIEPDDWPVAEIYRQLGITRHAEGRFVEAEQCFSESLDIFRRKIGPRHWIVAETLWHVADLMIRQGRFHSAKQRLEDALAIYRRIFRPDHWVFGESLRRLGRAEVCLDELPAAEEHLGNALAIVTANVARHDLPVSPYLRAIAALRRKQHRLDESIALLEEALETTKAATGMSSVHVADQVAELAKTELLRGNIDRAAEHVALALRVYVRTYGEEHWSATGPILVLAQIERARGNFVAARGNAERALENRERYFGGKSLSFAEGLRELGLACINMGDLDGAQSSLNKALGIFREELGERHTSTAETLQAQALLDLRRHLPERAAPEFSEALEVLTEVLGSDHPDSVLCVAGNTLALSRLARGAAAESLHSTALDLAASAWGDRHWRFLEFRRVGDF